MRRIIGLICFLMFFGVGIAFANVNYARVDAFAKDAPMLKNSRNLHRLVRYLVEPYKKDAEKARVLLAWIVYNIDYDGYKLNAVEDKLQNNRRPNRQLFIPDNDILETRLGVCGDIAGLYQRMGKMAGLDVALIYGRVKQVGAPIEEFETGPGHVWTAVKIDDDWEYVDPTFALGADAEVLGDVERKREYQRIVKQRSKKNSSVKKARDDRQVDDQWFLTDKNEMIKTHFPNDDQWQLQDKKLSKQEFLGLNDREYRRLNKQQKKRKKREVVK